MNTLNAYELLNVAPTASRDEIRAAYRDLARRWHPDRFMAGPERDWANNRMADINAAYRACLDGLTNARVEAVNNKIKLIVKMAYGFRNVDNLFSMVMLKCSDLRVELPGR